MVPGRHDKGPLSVVLTPSYKIIKQLPGPAYIRSKLPMGIKGSYALFPASQSFHFISNFKGVVDDEFWPEKFYEVIKDVNSQLIQRYSRLNIAITPPEVSPI